MEPVRLHLTRHYEQAAMCELDRTGCTAIAVAHREPTRAPKADRGNGRLLSEEWLVVGVVADVVGSC